ncbi:MAG: hypothetical protein AAGF26_10415 [Cyanobacteria bacterium P01_G01_bin.49]
MCQSQNKTINQIATLLSRYGFELNSVSVPELIEDWSAIYSVYWIRLAIVEALYQGRYKVISIEHILTLWKRRGQPMYHFNHDFERLITNKLVPNQLTHQVTDTNNLPENYATREQESAEISLEPITLTPVKELVKKITASPPTLLEELSAKTEKSHSNREFFPEIFNNQNNGSKGKRNNPSNPNNGDRSIHQFIPHCDSSDFYGKLRAVAHRELAENYDR